MMSDLFRVEDLGSAEGYQDQGTPTYGAPSTGRMTPRPAKAGPPTGNGHRGYAQSQLQANFSPSGFEPDPSRPPGASREMSAPGTSRRPYHPPVKPQNDDRFGPDNGGGYARPWADGLFTGMDGDESWSVDALFYS